MAATMIVPAKGTAVSIIVAACCVCRGNDGRETHTNEDCETALTLYCKTSFVIKSAKGPYGCVNKASRSVTPKISPSMQRYQFIRGARAPFPAC